MTITSDWRTTFLNDRQQKELAFSELYVRDFNHGATGHNLYVIIARLAELLDVASGAKTLPPPVEGGDLVLTFGKYRNQYLADVWRRDPGYVEWLAREGRDADVRAAAAALLVPAGQQRLFDEPPAPETEADDLL
ncbi:MAG: hypothetical protein IPK75_17965 [Acidobacteria bacterium]|nr:hypothetical protein [Acidobacteriota bacterium]